MMATPLTQLGAKQRRSGLGKILRATGRAFMVFGFFCLTGAIVLSSQAGRSAARSGYYRLDQAWSSHWPFARGGSLVGRLAPVMMRMGVIQTGFVEVEPGAFFYLDPRDFVAREILKSGQWQPEVWDSLARSLPQGAVFLDVGAHIGYFSVKAALKVGENGRVVAFEPNTETLRFLRVNIAASGLQNVIVEPIACWHRDEQLVLYASGAANTGASSLSRKNAEIIMESSPRPFTVRGRPIDDVVAELGLDRVDAMKIDVEGAEFGVLQGARKTLVRFHPRLVIEMDSQKLSAMGTTPEQIVKFLKGAGYTQSRSLGSDLEWLAP